MKTNHHGHGGFAYRVNFSAAVISRGGKNTRSFDNCFENWDGDAVAVALYRRSRSNEKLRKNLWRYIGRRLCIEKAFQHRRISTRKLPELSASLIAEAKARSEAFLADRAA